MTETRVLSLDDYRDMVSLVEPCTPAPPASTEAREGLVRLAIAYLEAEGTGESLREDRRVHARNEPDARARLRALLTLTVRKLWPASMAFASGLL